MLPGLRSLKRTECMFLQYGTDKEADASVAPFYGELYPQGRPRERP